MAALADRFGPAKVIGPRIGSARIRLQVSAAWLLAANHELCHAPSNKLKVVAPALAVSACSMAAFPLATDMYEAGAVHGSHFWTGLFTRGCFWIRLLLA
jgi:hypothetical protein